MISSRKTKFETLKTDDLEVKIDGKKLPVLSASRDFNNRLLILLETEGSAKNDKLADLVSTVTQQARQAPEGKPVAFGVFAEKASFTKGFSSEPEMRTAAVNEVVEGAPPLGKRVALWDALHQALALFGPHQPGTPSCLSAIRMTIPAITRPRASRRNLSPAEPGCS